MRKQRIKATQLAQPKRNCIKGLLFYVMLIQNSSTICPKNWDSYGIFSSADNFLRLSFAIFDIAVTIIHVAFLYFCINRSF